MRRWLWWEEVAKLESPKVRVARSRGHKVQGSQGPRYLKITFKYELDSKEGPSCFISKTLLKDRLGKRE